MIPVCMLGPCLECLFHFFTRTLVIASFLCSSNTIQNDYMDTDKFCALITDPIHKRNTTDVDKYQM